MNRKSPTDQIHTLTRFLWLVIGFCVAFGVAYLFRLLAGLLGAV